MVTNRSRCAIDPSYLNAPKDLAVVTISSGSSCASSGEGNIVVTFATGDILTNGRFDFSLLPDGDDLREAISDQGMFMFLRRAKLGNWKPKNKNGTGYYGATVFWGFCHSAEDCPHNVTLDAVGCVTVGSGPSAVAISIGTDANAFLPQRCDHEMGHPPLPSGVLFALLASVAMCFGTLSAGLVSVSRRKRLGCRPLDGRGWLVVVSACLIVIAGVICFVMEPTSKAYLLWRAVHVNNATLDDHEAMYIAKAVDWNSASMCVSMGVVMLLCLAVRHVFSPGPGTGSGATHLDETTPLVTKQKDGMSESSFAFSIIALIAAQAISCIPSLSLIQGPIDKGFVQTTATDSWLQWSVSLLNVTFPLELFIRAAVLLVVQAAVITSVLLAMLSLYQLHNAQRWRCKAHLAGVPINAWVLQTFLSMVMSMAIYQQSQVVESFIFAVGCFFINGIMIVVTYSIGHNQSSSSRQRAVAKALAAAAAVGQVSGGLYTILVIGHEHAATFTLMFLASCTLAVAGCMYSDLLDDPPVEPEHEPSAMDGYRPWAKRVIKWILETEEHQNEQVYGRRIVGRRICLYLLCGLSLYITAQTVHQLRALDAEQAITALFNDVMDMDVNGSFFNMSNTATVKLVGHFDVARHASGGLGAAATALFVLAGVLDLGRKHVRWSRMAIFLAVAFAGCSLFSRYAINYMGMLDLSELNQCSHAFCASAMKMLQASFGVGLAAYLGRTLMPLMIDLPWTNGRMVFFVEDVPIARGLTLSTSITLLPFTVVPVALAYIYNTNASIIVLWIALLVMVPTSLAGLMWVADKVPKKYGRVAAVVEMMPVRYMFWGYVVYGLPLIGLVALTVGQPTWMVIKNIFTSLFSGTEWVLVFAEFSAADIFFTDLIYWSIFDLATAAAEPGDSFDPEDYGRATVATEKSPSGSEEADGDGTRSRRRRRQIFASTPSPAVPPSESEAFSIQ